MTFDIIVASIISEWKIDIDGCKFSQHSLSFVRAVGPKAYTVTDIVERMTFIYVYYPETDEPLDILAS